MRENTNMNMETDIWAINILNQCIDFYEELFPMPIHISLQCNCRKLPSYIGIKLFGNVDRRVKRQ